MIKCMNCGEPATALFSATPVGRFRLFSVCARHDGGMLEDYRPDYFNRKDLTEDEYMTETLKRTL